VAIVEPGKLQHLVFILNPEISVDSRADTIYKYPDGSYSDPVNSNVRNLPAVRLSIEPVVGRELLVAKGIRANVTHKMEGWFNPRITALTRLFWWNGTYWTIFEVGSPITLNNMNREMRFYACEVSR
jgi:hypothetical protein